MADVSSSGEEEEEEEEEEGVGVIEPCSFSVSLLFFLHFSSSSFCCLTASFFLGEGVGGWVERSFWRVSSSTTFTRTQSGTVVLGTKEEAAFCWCECGWVGGCGGYRWVGGWVG